MQVIALASVSSVCGRFHYGMVLQSWVIVDCSNKLAQPIFNVDED